VTFVRVGLDGARSFLFYRRGGADLSLAREHLAALPEPPLAGARWLHVCSSVRLCEPLASAARGLLEQAAATGVALSLDLNVRAHLWDDRERMEREVRALAAGAALVKASEEDLEALGLAPSLDALCALAPRALAVVLTLAERGAVARVGGRDVAVPAPCVTVVDATGAGDAFVAAVLAALEARGVAPDAPEFADPGAWERLLRVACDVGARAVTALGATEGVRELAEPRAAIAALRAV
jgi:fructokinase